MKNICIVGTGPSGLFCAHKILSEYGKRASDGDFHITMIEKGEKTAVRRCPGAADGICRNCRNCAVLSGGGGAGLFSDGKIIQDLNVGGHNDTVFAFSKREKEEYISYVTDTLKFYDGVSKYKGKPEEKIQEEYSNKFASEDLRVKYYGVLHMGSDNTPHILEGFIGSIEESASVDIKYGKTVTQVLYMEDKKYYLYAGKELLCTADYVVMAVGKSGASWLKNVMQPLGVKFNETGHYFGLRIEMPHKYLASLAELSFDPKIYRELSDGRKIKMHCFCRKGKVIMTNYENCIVAGGHSPFTENNVPFEEEVYGNFNVLLSYPSTSDYRAMLRKFKKASAGTLLVQSLEDFKKNKCTGQRHLSVYDRVNQIQVSNIRAVVDDEFFAQQFISFIESLDRIFPGIGNGDNLLYGPAFEWCMDTVDVSSQMETNLPNLFAVGDGAGISQGIMYSASTGIMAAKCIIERMMSDEA